MPPHDDRTFFDAFDAALSGKADVLSAWLAGDTPSGLSVYRNTIASGAVDALTATFSTVVLMTGADWFRAAAREYARAHPPQEPSLLAYGASFPEWLASFPPAADTPYLPGVATLDWLWWQAWSAADGEMLDGEALAELSEDRLPHVTLGLHPSVRIATFDVAVPSLWLAHQTPAHAGSHELGAEAEHILFVRAGDQVEARLITAGPHAFMSALATRSSLLEAAEAALASEPACSLQQILVTGLALGLFTNLVPLERN